MLKIKNMIVKLINDRLKLELIKMKVYEMNMRVKMIDVIEAIKMKIMLG